MKGHIHLMGICGSGMTSLAGMLKEKGFYVTGSDSNPYPPASVELEKLGIKIMKGYSPENLNEKPDLVIVGNVITRNNLEAQALLSSGIPYLSMPDAFREFFLKDKYPIVVAGTHGKSTTTALLAWILEHNGFSPSMFLGGVSIDFGKGWKLGDGDIFVIEGDEYDTAFFDKTPKFIHYNARFLLLTSLEFDHGDIYRSVDDIKHAFINLVEKVPECGIIGYSSDYPLLVDVVSRARCKTYKFGIEGSPYWKGERNGVMDNYTEFSILRDGVKWGEFQWQKCGLHNIQNAVAAVSMAAELGASQKATAKALRSFRGVKRRQELRGIISGIEIVEDFAHHPTSVKVTLQGLRDKYGSRRIWAIFEPRSNTSRRKFFQDLFPFSFDDADEIIISEIYNPDGIKPEERLDVNQLVEDLKNRGKKGRKCNSVDEIVKILVKEACTGDVVVIMSNGSFGGLIEKLMEALRANAGS